MFCKQKTDYIICFLHNYEINLNNKDNYITKVNKEVQKLSDKRKYEKIKN